VSVQQHLDFVQQRVVQRRAAHLADAPAARLAGQELELPGEMPRKGAAQRVGLGLLHGEGILGRAGYVIAHYAQVRRVGARPERIARLGAAAKQG
jgi:hypothetical protein